MNDLLIDGFAEKYPKFWSVRFHVLGAIAGILEIINTMGDFLMPALQDYVPAGWFAVIGLLFTIAGLVARAMKQTWPQLEPAMPPDAVDPVNKQSGIAHPRMVIAALTLSAAGFAGLIMDEGYTDRAVVPTVGDRYTVGFGSTFREDGTPVQKGDTITPQKAVARTLSHIQKDESGIKACVKAPLSQTEFDLFVDFSYQYGVKALCDSSMVRHVNGGRYTQSCETYLAYKYAAGYDCSTLVNGRPNKRCWGVWERSKERYQTCMAAQ